jgi:hypothetical protein
MNFYTWAMVNGYKDGLEIDRIDGNKDYSPDNCRFVTHTKNLQNKGIYKTNKTGYDGVSFWHNYKYSARIAVNKKSYWIGLFNTDIEAAIARNNFIIEHGFDKKLNIIK